jgi:hypothetical protein
MAAATVRSQRAFTRTASQGYASRLSSGSTCRERHLDLAQAAATRVPSSTLPLQNSFAFKRALRWPCRPEKRVHFRSTTHDSNGVHSPLKSRTGQSPACATALQVAANRRNSDVPIPNLRTRRRLTLPDIQNLVMILNSSTTWLHAGTPPGQAPDGGLSLETAALKSEVPPRNVGGTTGL